MIFFGAKLEIFLLITLYFALNKGALAGVLCGVLFGFLDEIFSSANFGAVFISYIITGLLAGMFKERLYFENPWYLSISVFAAIILYYFIQFTFSGSFSIFMVYSAFFSAAISPLLFSRFNPGST